MNAQFDRVESERQQACPPAPVEACHVLGVVSLWWQIQINPESRVLDRQLAEHAAAASEQSAQWTRREPQNAEAWFYLAGSYAPLVQWRVLRGERVTAAREGGKAKTALEHALALDPDLHDAHFGIGLYRYYADVAPAAARMLRWLLFLPGGDRVKGLREMLQARDKGELLTGEADYQLHLVYLWYEKKPREALSLLQSLDARYPNNPLFLQRIAEIEDVYFHDHRASADAWEMLLGRARHETIYSASIAETRARLGLASQFAALDAVDEAIEQLTIVVGMERTALPGARARAERELRALRARQVKK